MITKFNEFLNENKKEFKNEDIIEILKLIQDKDMKDILELRDAIKKGLDIVSEKKYDILSNIKISLQKKYFLARKHFFVAIKINFVAMFFLPYRTRKKNFRFKRKNCFYLLNFCFMAETKNCAVLKKTMHFWIETIRVFGI